MQRTRQANIVRFFGAGKYADDTPFLVEELMAGPLKTLLRGPDAQRLDVAVKIGLARDTACGIAHIHSLGHIHRDLKSGNVLVTANLQAKVADFGSIGRLLRVSGRKVATRLPLVTAASAQPIGREQDQQQTVGVGTPLYMSVEMLQGHGYDQATDVWSFGVLLWEILTQREPDLLRQEQDSSRGPLMGRLLRLLLNGHRLAVEAVWPSALQDILCGSWAADPSARPTMPLIEQQLLGVNLSS